MSKTDSCCFHLKHKMVNTKLEFHFNDTLLLHHNTAPKYFGVTLDRTLPYKKHLTNTVAKLKTRNNIPNKLAGSCWGVYLGTLRTTFISLVYSVVEYWAIVWINSSHTHIQLNNSMRSISGAIKTTPLYWQPVLSYIEPPHLRQQLWLHLNGTKFEPTNPLYLI